MFVPELGVALLNIPKCGSSTVRQCLQFHVERQKVTPVQGQYVNHLTLSELKETAQQDGFNIDNMRVVAVVRNPIDRLLSNLNFLFADRFSYSLDKCMSLALSDDLSDEHRNLRPMSSFLDADIKGLELFPFEKIIDAVRSFGYSGIVPCLNKSRKRFSVEQLELYIDDISSFYRDDFKIYNVALAKKEIEYVRQAS